MKSAEALAASLPPGSRKVAEALLEAGETGPVPDDADFVAGELAAWRETRGADAGLLGRMGISGDAAVVRESLALFRRLSPRGLDPLGLGVLDRWEGRPRPAPGPLRLSLAGAPSRTGRAEGAADSSPDGSLFLTAGRDGLALYAAEGTRELWSSEQGADQAFFWDGSILSALAGDDLPASAAEKTSLAGAKEGRLELPGGPWDLAVFAGFSRDRSGAVLLLYGYAGDAPQAAFLDVRSMSLADGGRLFSLDAPELAERLENYAMASLENADGILGFEDLSGFTARLESAWRGKFGGGVAAHVPSPARDTAPEQAAAAQGPASGQNPAPGRETAAAQGPAPAQDAAGAQGPAGPAGNDSALRLYSGDGRSLLAYGPGRTAAFYRIGEAGAPEPAGNFSMEGFAAYDPRPMAFLGAPPGQAPRALFLFTVGAGDGLRLAPYDKERDVRLCVFGEGGPSCASLAARSLPLAAAAADPASGYSVLAFLDGSVRSLDLSRGEIRTLSGPRPVRWAVAALCPGARLALLADDAGGPWFLDMETGALASAPAPEGAVLASSACAGDGSAVFAGLADGRILRASPGREPERLAAAEGIPYAMVAGPAGTTIWWAEDRAPGGWGPSSPWNDDGERGLLPPLRQDPARSRLWRETGLYFGYYIRGLRELPATTRLARLDLGAAGASSGAAGAQAAPGGAPLVWDRALPPLELHLDPATSRPLALALRVTGLTGGSSDPDSFSRAESAAWEAGGADLLILDRRAPAFSALDREFTRYLPGPGILYRLAFNGQDAFPGQALALEAEGPGKASVFSPWDAKPFATMDTPSPDGGLTLAYGGEEGGAGSGLAVMSLLSGRILQEGVNFALPSLPVTGGAVVDGGRKALTWSSSGSVTLWDLTGQEAEARLSVFFTPQGGWVALGPGDRYDTDDHDFLDLAAYWIRDGGEASAGPAAGGEASAGGGAGIFPFSAFMRDFYQPRLAEYVWHGAALPPAEYRLGENLFRHSVEITRAEAAPCGAGEAPPAGAAAPQGSPAGAAAPDCAEVTAKVRGLDTDPGFRDLKLFLGRRLAASLPGPFPAGPEGEAEIMFRGVPLPGGGGEAALSAYGYSSWNVRSEVGRAALAIPDRPRLPKARILSFGVNDFSDPAWNLSYADEDARGLSEALREVLAGERPVEAVRLSTAEGDVPPTKEGLKAALAALAGGEGASGPDDMVVVTVSTHGLTSADGVFHILPADASGDGRGLEGLDWGSLVSSDELARWLAPVAAGELVLVMDTCQSGAAVGGGGFRPGPMGDRGLGQLAYDKAARVICAVDENALALESPDLRNGVLSYALIEYLRKPGAEPARRGFSPVGWLRYGRARAAEIYALLRRGAPVTGARGIPLSAAGPAGEAAPEVRPGQSPLLYDFGGPEPAEPPRR
ncbi:MAG: caspase family protein [Deltaproteobacteria bacterium]|nr:caspase family protein [Deltaproteobacteria bacterium]